MIYSCVALAALASGEPDGTSNPIPSPIQLQAECLKYRGLITKHGHIAFHVIDERRTGPEAGSREAEYRIWFSDERLRFDVSNRVDQRWSDWENYVVDKDQYTWIPEGDFEGVVAPASEYKNDRGGVIGHFGLFHPRWLGMGQNSEALMHQEPTARTISPTITKANYQVDSVQLNGFDAWKITRKTSFPGADSNAPRIPGEFVIWLVPNAGMSLLRAELREFDDHATTIRTVESELQQFPEIGAWFPKRMVRETTVGDKTTRHQTITVREAAFGNAPNDFVFTLAGLGLPKGKRISDRSRGPRETVLQWDGQQIIPVRGPITFIDLTTESRQYGWLFVLNVALVAVLGTVYVVRLVRNRYRESST